MGNFNADDLLRITRALNSHEQKCREIASCAHDLGQRSTVAAMCKEAEKAKQLSSKSMEAHAARVQLEAQTAPGTPHAALTHEQIARNVRNTFNRD